ncbi:MAG TPA: hypothetical protein VFS03_09740 [Microvirga sp.]|nr:hypothetical protein [Microvirga sp.]
MTRSATLPLRPPAPAGATRWIARQVARRLRRMAHAVRRERARRQLAELDAHLRRDIGLAPHGTFDGWSDPYDPRARWRADGFPPSRA